MIGYETSTSWNGLLEISPSFQINIVFFFYYTLIPITIYLGLGFISLIY